MQPQLARLARLARLAPLAPLALCLFARAPSQSFRHGDVYLVSNALPSQTVPGTFAPGVLRIDVFTGATQRVLAIQSLIFNAISAFDPHRGGIVVPGRIAGMPVTTTLMLVLADGTATALLDANPANRVSAPAPTGDGRIYWVGEPGNLQLLDAQGVVHDVLDATGTQPIPLPRTNALVYHGGTNAVFALNHDTGSCVIPNNTVTYLHKIPLTPGGRRAASATVTVPVCTSPIPITPNHFSPGPGGTIFFSVDDNTNLALTRTFVFDPNTLVITPFASNGPYTGASSMTAAVYSSRLGAALLMDGFNEMLRLYPRGSAGPGTVFATGTSGHTSVNTLIEIPPSGIGVTSYGTGTAGCAGLHAMGVTVPPAVGAVDFRFTCTAAPPSSVGATLLGNAAFVAGADPFGLGILLHIDPFRSAFLIDIPMVSSPFGAAVTPAPIPLAPSTAGLRLNVQTLWLWTTCRPTVFGLSSSDGLAVVIQP